MATKNENIARRKRGIRKQISGSAERPRLSVFRSGRNIYAQMIDDVHGVTLAAASSLEKDISGESRVAVGKEVGLRLAQRAKDAGISKAVFDRNGYRYHGRVKALAEGVREGGIEV